MKETTMLGKEWGEVEVLHGGEKGVKLRRFEHPSQARDWLAAEILATVVGAIQMRGEALLLGAGGSTPRALYEQLGRASLNWDKVTLATVDERFVPLDDQRSNTRMMKTALAPILADDIGPGLRLLSLMQDITDEVRNAEDAEKLLIELGHEKPPVWDFAVMGMGDDGHYASIFPNNAINAMIYETDSLVLPVGASESGAEPIIERVTMTPKAINTARRIVFYIVGQHKLDVVRRMADDHDPYRSPIGAFLKQCPAPVEFVWAL